MTAQTQEESREASLHVRLPWAWLLPVGLVAIILLVFSNSFGREFIWYDNALVAQNPFLQDPGGWIQLFLRDVWSFAPGQEQGFDLYRPLVSLTYLADVQLWGDQVRQYHITNLLFHTLSTLVVYGILQSILGARGPAWVGALLFGIHPVHTEAVTWITGRAEVVGGFFFFLSFFLYLRFRQKERWTTLLGSLLALLLALLSDEMAFTLPLVILLYHLCFDDAPWRGQWRELDRTRIGSAVVQALPYLAVVVLYLSIRWIVLGPSLFGVDSGDGVIGGEPATRGVGAQLLLTTRIVTLYSRLVVFPFPLNAVREVSDLASAAGPMVWLSPLIFAIVLALGLLLLRRAPVFAFAILFFLVTILPVSLLSASGEYVGERLLYVPSFSLSLAAAAFAAWLWRRQRTIAIALIVVVALSWAVLTFTRNTVWQDPMRFWTAAVAASPRSTEAHNMLGLEHWYRGQNLQATMEFEQTLQIDSENEAAYNNLGIVYASEGRYQEAGAAFQKAVDLAPYESGAYENLGLVYEYLGQPDLAIAAYQQALDLDPLDPTGYLNLARLFAALERWDEAADQLLRLLGIQPNSIQALLGLGQAYLGAGDVASASAAYEEALRIDPRAVPALNDLGLIRLDQGQTDQAVDLLERAVQLVPESAPTHLNLALAYQVAGANARALQELAIVLQLDPGNEEAERLIQEWQRN